MNIEKPLVSVLLSIYKVEEYIEECLDSILAQSYTNLEIVCVDNGSPDKCGKILEKYAKRDKRIKVVTLSENKMLCGGRNAGLDNATGDFICFVDPDDWIEKDYIKSMVEVMQTQKDPEGKPYNLIMNYAAINYMKDPKTGRIRILYDNPFPSKSYSLDDYNIEPRIETNIPMWGRLYRKSFLDKYNVKFLEGYHTDNIPYTTKLFAHMNYYYAISKESHPNSAYWRRMITPEGAITPLVLYKNLEIPYCLENLYDYLKEHGLSKKVRVMYHLFWTLCFPRHEDMPRYYQKFKNLMIKMEDDIKSAPDTVYQQCDRDLCNLLIYTSDFFQFAELYFRKPEMYYSGNYTFKLFNFISVFKKKTKRNKTKYYILGVPVWVSKSERNIHRDYLFGFIPLLKCTKK